MDDIFSEGVENRIKDSLGATNESDVVESQEERERELDKAVVERIGADTDLRKRLANKSYWFMVLFVSFVCLLIGWDALSYFLNGEHIPEKVVIALITSQATIVGLVGFVVKGLFRSQ